MEAFPTEDFVVGGCNSWSLHWLRKLRGRGEGGKGGSLSRIPRSPPWAGDATFGQLSDSGNREEGEGTWEEGSLTSVAARWRPSRVHSNQGMLVDTTAKPLTAVASMLDTKWSKGHYHSSNFSMGSGGVREMADSKIQTPWKSIVVDFTKAYYIANQYPLRVG